MIESKKWLPTVVFLAALLALPGCVKLKWLVTIYPDDSGKLELTIGMSSMLSGFAEMGEGEGGAGPSATFADPREIADGSQGFVAWTAPEKSTSGDYKMTKVTGYFEDINKIALDMKGGDEEDSEATSWSFKKNEDGTFEASFIDKSMNDDITEQGGQFGGDDSPEAKELVKSMAKSTMAGFEMSYGFVMPGEVAEAEGMRIEGRNATMKIDIDKLFDMEEGEAKKGFRGVVKSGPAVEGLEEEMAAFQKEVEEAKVAWRKILEDAKADKEATEKAAGEKKEAGEGEGHEEGDEKGSEGKKRKKYAPAAAR